VPLSNAQSLRVIGQNLGVLSVDSFELVKFGDEYIVSLADSGREQQRGFLSKIIRRLSRHHDLTIPNPIRFTSSDILQIDTQRRLQRGSHGPIDRRDLSFILRVLGDYLDGKGAGQFAIQWSNTSVKIIYEHGEETFSHENLYDFGIKMYLRRSSRV
jgi:hypothetical protein